MCVCVCVCVCGDVSVRLPRIGQTDRQLGIDATSLFNPSLFSRHLPYLKPSILPPNVHLFLKFSIDGCEDDVRVKLGECEGNEW